MPAPDARARAIVARLSEGNASSDEVFAAFEELDHLPPEVVRGAFEPWTGPAPDPEKLDDQVRRAHRLPLRTPRLAVLGSTRDADVLDLGDLAEAQLRLAGKTWDGQDLEAFDRLDGEREDSFAGTLERRVLGEGDKPLYDVLLFGEGAGVFFRAGTTQVLGLIADNLVETSDRPARLAIERALAEAPPAAPAAPVTPASPVASKAPAQKQLGLSFLEAAPEVAGVSAEPASMEPVSEEPVTVPFEAEPANEPEDEAVAPAPKKKKKTASAKKKTATAAPPPPKKKAQAKAKAKVAAKKTGAAPAAPKKKAASAKKKTAAKKTTKRA